MESLEMVMPSRTFQMVLDDQTAQRLAEMAGARGLSRGAVIRNALNAQWDAWMRQGGPVHKPTSPKPEIVRESAD